MSENERETSNKDFVAYPINSLVAAFHAADSLNIVITELKKKGFADDDMRSFSGQEGVQELDFDGSANGRLTEFLRSLQRIGPSRTYLERYEKYMRDGDCILMVYAPQEQRKQTAADIMRKHSAHRVTYFGLLVMEEV